MYLKHSQKFTLIELLVVVAIMGVLLSLISPALKKMNQASNDMMCKRNLNTTFTASSLYIDDHEGYLMGPAWPGHRPLIQAPGGYRYSNFSALLEQYMLDQTTTADDGYTYNTSFICPTNKSLDLQGQEMDYQRVNYRHTVGWINGKSIFGRPESRFYGPEIAPSKLAEIENPNNLELLLDADGINSSWLNGSGSDVSEYPVHQAAFRNTLFFDGAVRPEQWTP